MMIRTVDGHDAPLTPGRSTSGIQAASVLIEPGDQAVLCSAEGYAWFCETVLTRLIPLPKDEQP